MFRFCFLLFLISFVDYTLSLATEDVPPFCRPGNNQTSFHNFPFIPKLKEDGDCMHHNPDLSTYVGMLYKLMKNGGIFDKLFNVHLSSCQAYGIFYDISVYFAKALGVSDKIPQVLDNANLAYAAYQKGMSAFDLFKTYHNSLEHYIIKEGYMTEDDSESVAYFHYQLYKETYNAVKYTNDPRTILYNVEDADVKFLKSFGEMEPDDVVYIMSKYGIELKCALDSL